MTTTDDTCVFCGARALRDLEGRVVSWAVRFGQGGDHEHETLAGVR